MSDITPEEKARRLQMQADAETWNSDSPHKWVHYDDDERFGTVGEMIAEIKRLPLLYRIGDAHDPER